MKPDLSESQGVQELIERLREKGIQSGREEAERIVQSAQAQAVVIVEAARKEAQAIRDESRKSVQEEAEAGLEALKLAVRDTQLHLKAEIMALFTVQLKRLVSAEMTNPELIRSLILAVAGAAGRHIPEGKSMEILIADSMLERDIGADNLDTLHDLVVGVTSDLLRSGVELSPSVEIKAGIRIRLEGEDMVIDLTEETVAALLAERLLPRFRAVAEGVGF